MDQTLNAGWKGFVVIVGVMLALLVCVWAWGLYDTRVRGSAEAVGVQSFNDLVKKWNDADAVARATSRMSLASPVAALQSVKQEADRAAVPDCLFEAKKHLVAGMERKIEGYLLFMSNSKPATEYEVRSALERSEERFSKYYVARRSCGSAAS